MKYVLVFVVVSCFTMGAVRAQSGGSFGLYSSLQLTRTRYNGVKGSLDFHWRRKHSIGFSMAWLSQDPNNIPSDYDQYRPHTINIFGGSSPVPNSFYIWSLSYGRYITLDRAGTARLRLQAGLSAGIYEGLDNFRLVYYPASGGFFGSNAPYYAYEYDDITRRLYGITLNPAFEYTPARCFGFTVGTLACINNQRFCMAAEFGILFGKVRSRVRKKGNVHPSL